MAKNIRMDKYKNSNCTIQKYRLPPQVTCTSSAEEIGAETTATNTTSKPQLSTT